MSDEVRKVKCKNKDCNKMILETTAKKTGGYCYPCYNHIEAKKDQEYIRKNRVDIDPYDGINDLVEIIKIMFKKKEYDPLINYIDYPKSKQEVFSLLKENDIKRLKEYAIKLYKTSDEEYKEILLYLICCNAADINDFLKILIEDNNIQEPSLFKGASDEAAQMLIEKLNDNNNTASLNNILCALAMIGNERVVNLFEKWKNEEPDFAKKLYISPYEYSFEGGWMLDENGRRKDLCFDKCYAIKQGIACRNNITSFYKKNHERCRFCRRELTSLFRLNLSYKEMDFLKLKGKEVNIASCLNCSCYETIFTNIDTDGNVSWSEYNTKPEQLYYGDDVCDIEDIKKDIYLDVHEKNINYCSSEFIEDKLTKIGGYPAWIQDAEYPKCPKCREEMMFLGQLSCEDFEEYGEGIYYGFICRECMISATLFRQT